MKLVDATKEHVVEMMAWFPDRDSCADWGGPMFRFPFTERSFLEDVAWGKLPSYSLLGPNAELIGFGQYYLREARCHLGRLVVSPAYRGSGSGTLLIQRLMDIGCRELGVRECSLFVLEHNEPAIQCYRKVGFQSAIYPGDISGFADCLYMVKADDKFNQRSIDSDMQLRGG